MPDAQCESLSRNRLKQLGACKVWKLLGHSSQLQSLQPLSLIREPSTVSWNWEVTV